MSLVQFISPALWQRLDLSRNVRTYLPFLAVTEAKDASFAQLSLQAADHSLPKRGIVGEEFRAADLAIAVDVIFLNNVPNVRLDLLRCHVLFGVGKVLDEFVRLQPAVLVDVGKEKLVNLLWRQACGWFVLRLSLFDSHYP